MAAQDTIAAIATAPGRGAVGIVRVSGPRVPNVAVALLGSLPPPRYARFGRFLGAAGETLDHGLALYFAPPASFTGEAVLELQGHGGAVVLDLLLKRLMQLGCRAARPGEFSERAYLNGKIDIAQAEAVADLIDAGSAAAARAAVRSMQGEFSARIMELQQQITELRAYTEAAIDFPDEDVDFLAGAALSERLGKIFAGFDAIGGAARRGALLRDGLNIVIAGKPNAGKSSLLNRLAGAEVAIVADTAGTTRDVLRQPVHLDGLPLHLIDTAGLREPVDAVEAEGVRRARAELAKADRVLYVVDAGAAGGAGERARGVDPALAELPPGVPVTLVYNKIDLIGMPARIDDHAGAEGAVNPAVTAEVTAEVTAAVPAAAVTSAAVTSAVTSGAITPVRIFLSAKTGAGLDLLREHLKQSAGYGGADAAAGAFSARRRHLGALDRARDRVDRAAASLIVGPGGAVELFAEELRLAQRALGEITGEFSSDDLLGEIFGSFCIGK